MRYDFFNCKAYIGTVLACSQDVLNLSEMRQLLAANLKSTAGPNSIVAARTGFVEVLSWTSDRMQGAAVYQNSYMSKPASRYRWIQFPESIEHAFRRLSDWRHIISHLVWGSSSKDVPANNVEIRVKLVATIRRLIEQWYILQCTPARKRIIQVVHESTNGTSMVFLA